MPRLLVILLMGMLAAAPAFGEAEPTLEVPATAKVSPISVTPVLLEDGEEQLRILMMVRNISDEPITLVAEEFPIVSVTVGTRRSSMLNAAGNEGLGDAQRRPMPNQAFSFSIICFAGPKPALAENMREITLLPGEGIVRELTTSNPVKRSPPQEVGRTSWMSLSIRVRCKTSGSADYVEHVSSAKLMTLTESGVKVPSVPKSDVKLRQ